MTLVWEEREDATIVAFVDGRYSGWVHPAPMPGYWECNWRITDETELQEAWPRTWAWPLGEEPGHLWPTIADAKAAIEERFATPA